MDGTKEVTTPICTSVILTEDDGAPKFDPATYLKLVGTLQYFAFTCPDISIAVNKLLQFMHAPFDVHWQALKHLLHYLKGTIHHDLYLHCHCPLVLIAFLESDWGEVYTKGHSTTISLIYLGKILSHGCLLAISRSLDLQLKSSTQLWIMHQLSYHGLKISYVNLVYLSSIHQPSTVTTRVILTSCKSSLSLAHETCHLGLSFYL